MNATPAYAEQHCVPVVDDEPNIVDVVSMALRFQGFAVASAGTGRDALAAVRSFDPHLMVLDIMLPDRARRRHAPRRARQAVGLDDPPRRPDGRGGPGGPVGGPGGRDAGLPSALYGEARDASGKALGHVTPRLPAGARPPR